MNKKHWKKNIVFLN